MHRADINAEVLDLRRKADGKHRQERLRKRSTRERALGGGCTGSSPYGWLKGSRQISRGRKQEESATMTGE